MSVQQVYDFESVLSTAFTTVLAAAGLTVVNLNVTPTLQKPRPRVDLFVHVHGMVVPVIFVNPQTTGDWPRGAAYRAELKLQCSTDVNAEGKLSHAAYRSWVRSIGAVIGNLVNTRTFTGTVETQGEDSVVGTMQEVTFIANTQTFVSAGQAIQIGGVTVDDALNGSFTVARVIDDHTFVYLIPINNRAEGDANAKCFVPSSLLWHKVQFIVEGATTFSIAPDKSYEMSTISYNLDFSVQNNAWPLLDAP